MWHFDAHFYGQIVESSDHHHFKLRLAQLSITTKKALESNLIALAVGTSLYHSYCWTYVYSMSNVITATMKNIGSFFTSSSDENAPSEDNNSERPSKPRKV